MHEIRRSWKKKLARIIPFGVGQTKPHHFTDMFKVAWRNRDNPLYAWKVLSRGVCDGCALGVAGFHDWTIDGVHLCMTRLNLLRLNTMPPLQPSILQDIRPLQEMDNRQLRELGRLPYPFLRTRGARGFQRITWEEAYRRIAARIRATDPHRMGFFVTSRGVTNEIYYMAQKVARFLGTNNVDNAARICHSPSTAAMKHALGVGATTCSYKDWYGTDLIIFFGSNPANDQPVSTKYLHEAKKLGTRVVLVNPYQEPGMDRYWVPSTAGSALFGTEIADYWYPVSQGGDIAFLYGVIKSLVQNGGVDREFVEHSTAGFEELKQRVHELNWDSLERGSGLPRASMESFAALVAGARNAVLVWSMGITQHQFGADAVSMILNLGLLRGYVGRDKTGLMPIRGHSSVQGGAEMGAYANVFPGGVTISPESAANLSGQYGFSVPDRHGLTAVEMIEAAAQGKLDILYALGGNFLRTLPDPVSVREALQQPALRVHQDIVLTDQMLIEAGQEVILLPAKTRYEQDDGGTETSTERRVMFSPEIPREVGEARAEWRILRELAVAVRPDAAHLLGCETGWSMREEIARVVPFYDGVQHLRKTGDAFQYGGPHLCAGGKFPTPDGKARFRAVDFPVPPQTDGSFSVSTRRGKQFNTLIYAEVDPLNGAPRDAVLISREDAARLGLAQGAPVDLVSDLGRLRCRVHLAPIAPGNLQVHWPEGNVLIAKGRVDRQGGVPDYNARVRLQTPAAP